MNSALRAAYAAAGLTARVLAAAAPPNASGKVWRAFAARRGVRERFRRWAVGGRDPARPLLWVHAPSVGEGLQARPVLTLVRERRPDVQLAYTFYSPSAASFAASLDVDVADYLPFDTRGDADALLDALRPDALSFSKLDVWPMLAMAAGERGVRLALTSATLSEASSRRGRLATALLHDAYASLDAVGAIDRRDADRLVSLGVRADRVCVTGDTRYDQVWARAAAVDRASTLLAPLASARPTLVAGSTWPADEAMLLPAWQAARAQLPDARLVIAPHEPTADHLAPVERWARGAGLTIARLSDAAAPTADVVLIDRVGVLGELYALATVAFVGGGFHAAGLHSVLEPAAFGAPVLFGPRWRASRDAELLLAAGGAAAPDDPTTLCAALLRWLGDRAARDGAGSVARSLVHDGLGAAERSFAMLASLLPPPR